MGLVTIHDNAPTNHRYNYAAVEVTAAPQSATATATAKLAATVSTTQRVSTAQSHLQICRLTPRRFRT